MTRIVSIIPPIIGQHFNPKLLSISCPIFRDTSNTLLKIYDKICKQIEKKMKSGYLRLRQPKEAELVCKLKEEFEALYATIPTKEKKLQADSSHFTQEMFYRIGSLAKKDEDLYWRLRK